MIVLLIEDSPTERMLMTYELEELGVQVVAVDRIQHAHDVGACDCILLDLLLPDTGGVESVQKCRAAFPNKPIVVLTHIEDPAIRERCLEQGAAAYFCKGNHLTVVILEAMQDAIVLMEKRMDLQHAQRLLDEISDRLNKMAE